MRKVMLALAGLISLYLVGCGLLIWNRAAFLYPFDPRPYPTSVAGPDVEVLTLAGSPDIDVWVHRPDVGKPVFVYFTGNIGNPGRVGPVFSEMVVQGYGLAILVYRGGANTDGMASEAGLIADAYRVYDALDDLMGESIPPSRRILYGQSLGSGVASGLAVQVAAAGLVLETPFTRLCDVSWEHLPVMPYCMLLPNDRFATVERIAQIDMPLLVLHGTDDVLVPLDMGQAVFDAAQEPKELIVYQGGNHNDLRLFGGGIAARAFADRVTSN